LISSAYGVNFDRRKWDNILFYGPTLHVNFPGNLLLSRIEYIKYKNTRISNSARYNKKLLSGYGKVKVKFSHKRSRWPKGFRLC